MDLFRRYLSQPTEIGEDAGANVIETLVERLQTATRVEDRRDSMRGIKALSKRYRLEVGTQAMLACIEALSRDSEDSDTVSFALDVLCNIMNDEQTDLDPRELVNIPPDLGKQFTEIFLKDPENVQLVLSFLSSFDMHIRRQTIRLLVLMLQNNRKTVQDMLLYSPMAVSKFMATLSDPMEVIRNDGLLLLLYFSKNHVTIQKIVAFENVFERILSIVETETISDGGVVIEDCFRLLHQLLTGTQQNQILFKDGRFVQRLAKLFQKMPEELEESPTWSAQKLVNVIWLLKIFRTLVNPSNKTQSVKSFQAEMQACGLLDILWKVVMAGGVPAELLTETLYSLSEMVRGHPANQEAVIAMVAPSEPPQPAITVLLVTMVNERQRLAVRLAVLYCFQCLLAANKKIQDIVVSTLLPKHSEPNCVMSAGQLLCGGLFSEDGLTAWLSAIALFHSIHHNQGLKESLLQVHMAPCSGTGPPVTLMQQCFRLICQTGRVQGKIGLLQFLCSWLSHCPPAVKAFLCLRSSTNRHDQSTAAVASGKNSGAASGAGAILSHLIADVLTGEGEEIDIVSCLSALLLGICVCYNDGSVEDYDSKSLMKTIDDRIGIDDLAKRIGQVYRSDEFVRVIKYPVLEAVKPDDLVFDYDFTRLFKTIEFEVCACLFRSSNQLSDGAGAPHDSNQTETLMEKKEEAEKQWVQQQEMLLAYQRAVAERDTVLQNLQLRIIELERQLACAQRKDDCQDDRMTQDRPSTVLGQSDNHLTLAQKLEELQFAEKRIAELEDNLKAAISEKETLKTEHEDLLLLLSEQDAQINRFTADLERLSVQSQNMPQQLAMSSDSQELQQCSQAPTVNAMPAFSYLQDVLQHPPPANCPAYSHEFSAEKQQTLGHFLPITPQLNAQSPPVPPAAYHPTVGEQFQLTLQTQS